MVVAICDIEILIYESNSLKEKRSVVKSIIKRLQSRYNISIIESGNLDKWNIASIGFAILSIDKGSLDRDINSVINFIENDYRVELLSINREIY